MTTTDPIGFSFHGSWCDHDHTELRAKVTANGGDPATVDMPWQSPFHPTITTSPSGRTVTQYKMRGAMVADLGQIGVKYIEGLHRRAVSAANLATVRRGDTLTITPDGHRWTLALPDGSFVGNLTTGDSKDVTALGADPADVTCIVTRTEAASNGDTTDLGALIGPESQVAQLAQYLPGGTPEILTGRGLPTAEELIGKTVIVDVKPQGPPPQAKRAQIYGTITRFDAKALELTPAKGAPVLLPPAIAGLRPARTGTHTLEPSGLAVTDVDYTLDMAMSSQQPGV